MAHVSQMGVMTTEATKRWRKKQMKEHTITKTLFKMKKKKKLPKTISLKVWDSSPPGVRFVRWT